MVALDYADSTTIPQGSSALGISGDGNVITGTQFDYGAFCSQLPHGVCSPQTAIEQLEVFRQDSNGLAVLPIETAERWKPTSVSSDGSTIVGVSMVDSRPLRWRQDTGFQALPLGPVTYSSQFETVTSADGSLMGGNFGLWVNGITVEYASGQQRTFGFFVSSSLPIEPLFNVRRVRVQFTDSSGELRGSTSVAVVTVDQ